MGPSCPRFCMFLIFCPPSPVANSCPLANVYKSLPPPPFANISNVLLPPRCKFLPPANFWSPLLQIFARRVGPAAVRLLGKGISFRVCVARSWAAPQVHGPTGLGCVGPAAVRLPGLRTRVCQLGFAWPCSPSGPGGPNMPRRPRPPRQAGRPKRPRPPRRPKRPRRPEQPRRPKRTRRNMPNRPSRPLLPSPKLATLTTRWGPGGPNVHPKDPPRIPQAPPKTAWEGDDHEDTVHGRPPFPHVTPPRHKIAI